MTQVSDDQKLVKHYVAQGSDAAFGSLVARHVDLVYATALRQVGDRGVAEEITQNVFVALARKAPRLAGLETLAGWLHRTTILESKARIRSELRRRQREKKAIELAALEHEGVSPLEEMAPLLDEALLNLRENDRLALVLRFLQERSLREVGVALGIDEDAARKRVSRALERLTDFFRQRGFATPGVAGSASLLAGAAKAAPAGLAAAATNAGLAAGGAAGGLNLLLFHTMALTKTQTAMACCILAAAPLLWQHHAEARVNAGRAELNAQIAADKHQVEDLKNETQQTREVVLQAQAGARDAELRLTQVTSQIQGRIPRPTYRWDDNSPLARLPKSFLERLPLSAVSNRRGQMTEQIKGVLQMTRIEQEAAQGALDRFVAGVNAAQSATLRQVTPEQKELEGHDPGQTRVFQVAALGEQLNGLRQQLFDELEATLGAERFGLFKKALRDWMPLDEGYAGMNSGMAVFNFDHRVVFYEPQPGRQWLDWQIRKGNGEMMSFTVEVDDVPQAFRPHLQDWIALARSRPPGAAAPSK